MTLHPHRHSLALALPLILWVSACAITPHDELGPRIELAGEVTTTEESAPLGGEALSQRKLEMRRATRDLVHFHATLDSLNRRRDRSGQQMFRQFVDLYLGTQVAPLVSGEWQSHHPELAAMDASLRLLTAELLIGMREPSRAEHEIEFVAKRYQGHSDMIVSYPIGSQGTLQEALETLRERKWWRG